MNLIITKQVKGSDDTAVILPLLVQHFKTNSPLQALFLPCFPSLKSTRIAKKEHFICFPVTICQSHVTAKINPGVQFAASL